MHGAARQVAARHGTTDFPGLAPRGEVGSGMAKHVVARYGKARSVMDRQANARQGTTDFPGTAWPGAAGLGEARSGEVRRG